MRTPSCSNRPYLSRLGSSDRLSLVGTRTMYNWIPSSKASVLQIQSKPGYGLHAATHSMTHYQTECTTAVWSKERARPFLIPCSATVLSLWTTTLCPLRSLAKVERPRRKTYARTSTRSTRAATGTNHKRSRAFPAKLSGCHPWAETDSGPPRLVRSPCTRGHRSWQGPLLPLAVLTWHSATNKAKAMGRTAQLHTDVPSITQQLQGCCVDLSPHPHLAHTAL